MNNIERIFEAVCNILSVYVSFKVTDVFLEKKRKLPRMANIVYVLVWLINTVVAFGFRNAMGTTVSMVLLLWAAEGILYEGSILQKIMAGCFTVLLGLTIEFIMYYYLGDFSLFSEGRAMGTITGAMVNLLIAMGIRQVICRRRVMETQNYYFMILVLAGNIVWIYALESVSGENSPKTVLSLAIMIVVDLGMFYLYDRLGEAYQDKMQQRLLKEHMMVYQEQMHIMQQDQKKLDSLRHDMKNHMYLLQTYLNEGRYDKAQEYVNKMSEHLQTEHKYVNTGNLELDMILNHKLAKAEAMSCQIQSQIVIPLLDKLVDFATNFDTQMKNVAIGIDARSGENLDKVQDMLEILKSKDVQYEVLFLDAEDTVLVKRYKETRRSHPLAQGERVDKGIMRERQKMEFLKKEADYIIDTSRLLTRELKTELEKIFVQDEEFNSMYVTILSFGFKYGIPADSDIVMDVRFLPNPYYVEELRPKTGNDVEIQQYVMKYDEAKIFLNKLEDMVTFLIPHYISEGKNQLVISIGCTGGKHRSVTLANELYKRLSQKKNREYGLKIEHRDIGKDALRGK